MPEGKPGAGIVIKDAIADITLQQVLTRPTDFDVIATLNLNGDYLSDALAAQVGGIGIAPGGNINYITGHAIFEATHGTAPKYANKDVVNPGCVVLSRRNDVPLPGLDGSGRFDSQRLERRHRQQARHLRFRAPDGRRDGNQVLANSATTSSRICESLLIENKRRTNASAFFIKKAAVGHCVSTRKNWTGGFVAGNANCLSEPSPTKLVRLTHAP